MNLTMKQRESPYPRICRIVLTTVELGLNEADWCRFHIVYQSAPFTARCGSRCFKVSYRLPFNFAIFASILHACNTATTYARMRRIFTALAQNSSRHKLIIYSKIRRLFVNPVKITSSLLNFATIFRWMMHRLKREEDAARIQQLLERWQVKYVTFHILPQVHMIQSQFG